MPYYEPWAKEKISRSYLNLFYYLHLHLTYVNFILHFTSEFTSAFSIEYQFINCWAFLLGTPGVIKICNNDFITTRSLKFHWEDKTYIKLEIADMKPAWDEQENTELPVKGINPRELGICFQIVYLIH